MKIFRIILSGALVAAAVALLVYEYNMSGRLDMSSISKAAFIILGAIASLFRTNKRTVLKKKVLYQQAYSEYIQDVFSDEPRLERRFFQAVDDYNQNKPSAAVAKLKKLRSQCQRTSDLRAVTVFTALCLDEMRIYEQAIEQYDAALSLRDSSSLRSNKGLCLQRLGRYEQAEQAYQHAIRTDPANQYAHNNLSSLYFRMGNHEDALNAAEKAIRIDGKMTQALSTAAVCSHLLGDTEKYEKYYRQAVMNGYDGQKIKAFLRSIDTRL